MSVVLKEAIRQAGCTDIKLVAGKNGLTNAVEWVHMVDTTEIADFLSGGEIAFTTGIGVSEKTSLLTLVERVYKNHASAMVVNIGPYVAEIPQEVIDFGNVHDFPVFEVPWSVHMADMMRMICFTITQSQQRAMQLSAAFRYAIFTPKQEELYVSALMQKGYFAEWNYVVVMMDICDRLENEKEEIFYAPILKDRLERFAQKAARVMEQEKHDVVVFTENDRILMVFSDMKEEKAAEFAETVKEQIVPLLKNTESIFVGVGSTAAGFRRLSKSYQIARKIVDLSKMENEEDTTRTYASMGVNRLLFNIENTDCFEEYYQDTIQPLDEYDALNNSNLVEVLDCYMKHNGSVQDTAEELFVHRNTVNYKIKKIEALLNVDITKFSVRNELALGLLVAKLRKFSK